jgi:hypothetical protein
MTILDHEASQLEVHANLSGGRRVEHPGVFSTAQVSMFFSQL